jgi:transposase-like protein
VSTSENGYGDRRRRRRHSAEFKARVVAACRKRGVSIAAVALDHHLNANLLRRWVVAAERAEGPAAIAASSVVHAGSRPAPAAFVPIAVQTSAAGTSEAIVIELRRGSTIVKVNWPLAAAAGCAAWLGELLR